MRISLCFFLLFSLLVLQVQSKCIHDLLVREQKLKGKSNRQATNLEQIYVSADYPSESNTDHIRFHVDESFMDGDNDYTCYTVGQQITATNPSGDGGGTQSTYSCTQHDILSPENRDFLVNTLIPAAMQRLSDAIYVVPVAGNLTLASQNCGFNGGVDIPAWYADEGVADTDMVIFVTTRPILGGSVLAYGGPCQEDQYRRPIAGQLNFNPSTIDYTKGLTQTQLGTAMHETTHALGFTNDKFHNFRASDGSYYDAIGSVSVDSGTGDSPVQTNQATSPNVAAFVKSYFGCDTMVGAELEDEGGSGTAGSHWEKRIFMNDYMTGEQTQNPVFSELTLALLRDSGWYWTNYSQAATLLWGSNLGCDFATQSCANWPDSDGYRCAANSADQCTFDYQAKGTCGSDPLSDNCPYVRAYSNEWCFDTSQNGGDNQLLNNGELFAADSRCYSSTLLKHSPAGVPSQLVCYRTACQSSHKMKVQVDDFWYDCPAGKEVAIIDYGGVINCPDSITAQCGDAPTDNTWPIFTWIEPDSGEPGTMVTITGNNFNNVSLVYIAGPCTDVQVLNASYLVATLPTYDNIQNPSNFLKAKANVIVMNADGKNSMAYARFGLILTLNSALADAALKWVKAHWFVVLIAALVVVVIGVMIYYCCCRTKKKKEEEEDV